MAFAKSGSAPQAAAPASSAAPDPDPQQTVQPTAQAIAPPPVAAQVAAAHAALQPVAAKPVQTIEASPSSKARMSSEPAAAPLAAPVDAERSTSTALRPAAVATNPQTAARPDIAALMAEGGPDAEAPAPVTDEASGPDPTPAAPAAALTHRLAATETPRATPQTVAHLTAQIVKKLDGRSSRFDLQLDPLGLGNVDVRIEIKADGKMTAAMSFDTPQAAAELRARAGELQAAMEKAGFDLSGGMSFDVTSDRGQGRQAANQDTDAGFRGRAFQAALDVAGEAGDGALTAALNMRSGARSGVDVRI